MSKITLDKPIKRKDSEIAEVEITKVIEQAGSLRGLRLADVLNMEFESVSTLLSRVTLPTLTIDEIAAMGTADYVNLAQSLVPFLLPPGAGAPKEAATGDK